MSAGLFRAFAFLVCSYACKFTFSKFSGYRLHFGGRFAKRCLALSARSRSRPRVFTKMLFIHRQMFPCHYPGQARCCALDLIHVIRSFEFAASMLGSAAPSAPASAPAPAPTEPYIEPQQRTCGKGPKHRKRVRRAAIWYIEHKGQKDNSFAKSLQNSM